jgi:hypothetical protein
MEMADHEGTKKACFNNADDPQVQRQRLTQAKDYAFELDNIVKEEKNRRERGGGEGS